MTRAAAVVVATAVLAGCGSSGGRPSPAPPKLPRALAAQLAQRSDNVAAALDAGNPCGALDQASRLQQDTIRAINEGRVPGPLLENLSSTVSDLVGRIKCIPPVEEEHGKHGKGKGKHKGKHGDGD
jgi:hypothetical protein